MTCPDEGSNFRDPPRQGWRGGAPMDGFTACRRSCCLWPPSQKVNCPDEGSNFRDPPRQGRRGGAPKDGFTACRRSCFLWPVSQKMTRQTKGATSETLRAKDGAVEPPWMGSRRVGEVAPFGRFHHGRLGRVVNLTPAGRIINIRIFALTNGDHTDNHFIIEHLINQPIAS